jgi:aspartyl-tRNA(Asn)/glutamyl-tRNA(Gln) amidotransferase subunit A
MSIRELRCRLDARELSAGEIFAACMERILTDQARQDSLNAFIEVWPEEAARQAAEQDRRIAVGEASPLLGIPLAYKDNLHLAGRGLSCASRSMEGYRARITAGVLEKAITAGALLIGRTNLDEFAIGSTGESSCFGAVRNPHDRARVPGGSSSGSAAAVAAGMVPAALGSDTGGSVRQPASLCGIVGVKPTYGRISRYGLVAGASSMDHLGILARTVEDAALVLTQLAGYDARDGSSGRQAVPAYSEGLDGDLRGIRFGLPAEYFADGMEPEVASGLAAAIDVLRREGADIREIHLPHFGSALSVYAIIAGAETGAACMGKPPFGIEGTDNGDLNAERLGAGVRKRVAFGIRMRDPAYPDIYRQAEKLRWSITQDFDEAFRQIDVILTPTSPVCAFPLRAKEDDPLPPYPADVFTLSANLAGLPALSLPCAYSRGGLPVGMQLITAPYAEHLLFRAAHRIERLLALPAWIPVIT